MSQPILHSIPINAIHKSPYQHRKDFNPDKLNVNGGAIALGHPVGTTGTRLVITLLNEMKRRGVQHGLASLCIGGGQGAALHLERE